MGAAAEAKLDIILPKILGTDYQTLLRQQQPIEYDRIHATCYKNLVYYSSRFGVVYDSGKRKQQFYQGHKLKISAIAKHPFMRIVATGEVNVNPFIHVWDAQTLETFSILPTSHSGGVLHLVFSEDG
jgi:WD40 repeat protein